VKVTLGFFVEFFTNSMFALPKVTKLTVIIGGLAFDNLIKVGYN